MSMLSLFRNDGQPTSQPETLVGVYGEFCGSKILFAARGQETVAVGVESVRVDLDNVMNDRLAGFLYRASFKAAVSIDGTTAPQELIPLNKFFEFCGLNPSPRLNEFRDKLGKIAASVQNRGSYIAPGAGASAHLSPETENDEMSKMLAAMLQSRKETLRLQGQVNQIQGDVSAVRGQLASVQGTLAMRGSHMTVAAWFSVHGVKPLQAAINAGGMRVAQICRDRGWHANGKEMNGSQWPAQRWPVEALRIWWEEMGRQVSPDVR